MPGWHKATESLQKEGRIKTIGIIEEQHPDRCRLFMQWKEMDWPILVDPLNLLDVDGVPTTIFIDEAGIICYINPRLDTAEETLEAFINSNPLTEKMDDINKSKNKTDTASRSDNPQLPTEIDNHDSTNLTMAIQKYNYALSTDSDNGRLHFRLGVLYRMRYDSRYRQTSDFQNAVKHWQKALDLNPNQYIWRRRIQQYGPRLDKPYPFYDWIPKAREEIIERGEKPANLITEPGGAEYTKPLKIFTTGNNSKSEPDPNGKIYRDIENFINVEYVIVPSTNKSKNSSRVHLNFTPNDNIKAHWNNEVEGMKFWIQAPSGWQVDNNYILLKNPGQAVSKETRHIEFEISGDRDTTVENMIVSTYALYYVCEDVSGTCLYRRQDISIQLNGSP